MVGPAFAIVSGQERRLRKEAGYDKKREIYHKW